MDRKIRKGNIIIYLLLILGSIIMVLPFIWSVLTSFKNLTESLQVPPKILPDKWSMVNFKSVWNTLPFTSFFTNTFIMIAVRLITSTIFSAMAAYAFARLDFPGRGVLFTLVLLPMMVPSQIFILPQYLIVSKLGWANTVKALIVPGIVSTFGTFLLRQFFLGIPDELEEAAILDGCNTGQVFAKIMLPLAKSGIVSLIIFTSLFAWKDLMWPLIVNMTPEKMPLSSGLALLQGQYTTNYPELMAGSVIAIIPMVVLFIVFQKQFVEGIATTGSKN
ncbi:carbohydrate ABC transporter permease [Anaerocolumna sp. AGMB13025]|uniref:carbohydrate ABC transporter permease n=1 Tax=Anaerocolumna sp. AGMB13025 TaxID=3039116 RepID=UPI00241ECB58|nr:carbohydrate ABC transporter permease [Anaerocolumna sp. AGMB13025]WFR56293.1 carbohydrate ABC transporter permease [Anaerocolumna sp. AGMB13025]